MKKASIAIMWLLAATLAQSQAPQRVNYQGYLVDAGGQPVNTTLAMTFNLYKVASGGSALWTETQPAVAVAKGVYSVALGTVTPIGLPFDAPYYLGVMVGTDAEMTPRQPLGSAPYARRALQTDGLAPSAVTAGAIQNGTITPDRFGNFCTAGSILVRSAAGWQCGVPP